MPEVNTGNSGASRGNLWPDNSPTDPGVVAKTYDNYASTYSRCVLNDGWNSSFDLINPELEKLLAKGTNENIDKVVLDAGCGDGLLSEMFDFTSRGVKLYGIDISPEMLTIAKNRNLYECLDVANLAENLSFCDETFDIIVSNGVLGYLATAKPVYEFLRVLKPKGHVMFTMRESHFNERGFGKALDEVHGACDVLKKQVFSAFPNNPEYKHDYLFVFIRKH